MNGKTTILIVTSSLLGLCSVVLAIVLAVTLSSGPQTADATEVQPADDPDRTEQVGTEGRMARLATRLNRLAGRIQHRLGQADNDYRESALQSDLQTLRCQVELYKVQHWDNYPGVRDNESFDGRLFVRQMTGITTQDGKVNPHRQLEGDFAFGPYLQRMPLNPFVADDRAGMICGGPGPAPADGSTGWYFDTSTGGLWPNDAAHRDW